MPTIDPRAVVHPQTSIADDVQIGPYVIVEENVTIGSGCRLLSSCYIGKGTTMGAGNVIHPGAIIGHEPQDLAWKGEESFTVIGDNNVFREYVTIHRGTMEGSSTRVGNGSYLMAFAHVGHNGAIGNNVIIANGVLLAGHVTVADWVFVSGNVVIHQFVRVGTLAMIGGNAKVTKDVPPYMIVDGDSLVHGVNSVGLRRRGFTASQLQSIKEVYKVFYRNDMNMSQAMSVLGQREDSYAKELVDFVKGSKRGLSAHV